MRASFLVLPMAITACGGNLVTHVAIVPHPNEPRASAREQFETALASFVAHENANDWSPASCAQVASSFDAAAALEGTWAVATFDAALALERCHDPGAIAHFERALAADPKLWDARSEIALLRFQSDRNLDAAIVALDTVVRDAQFQNVAALVRLATLQMKRGGANDDEAAKQNLQRALAIDDASMPALNQLALYYWKTHHFEMGALVASQAIAKNDHDAPLYNTAGLLQVALGKTNLAVEFFQKAVTTDRNFFEAQMNLAESNLSFRGFARAEGAFRRAIALRDGDYDAHLGLALALRGQLREGNAAQIAAIHEELDACKRIDPKRPDAYFNEGILAQEFEAKASADPGATLLRSVALFSDFKTRAAGLPQYATALKRADDRVEDATNTRTFIK